MHDNNFIRKLINDLTHQVDWEKITEKNERGLTGNLTSKTYSIFGLRVRMIIYSAGYTADHWCSAAHIIHCMEGECVIRFKDGRQKAIKTGASLIVQKNIHNPHQVESFQNAKLLIIDSDSLQFDDNAFESVQKGKKA